MEIQLKDLEEIINAKKSLSILYDLKDLNSLEEDIENGLNLINTSSYYMISQ